MPDTPLRVRLLGGLEIEGFALADLGSRKARLLLKRLAIARGQVVSTDALIDALWPDGTGPAKPADQVAVLVSRLRALLGAAALVRRDAGYALVPAWLDLDQLEELVEEADRRLADGAATAALGAANAALTLARGPLLPDEADEEWLKAERGLADRLRHRALILVAQAALAAGRAADATEAGRRALDADPYDEQALQVLMKAAAASGRPAVGLRAYAETADRLRDELGVDPSPASQAQHLALLQSEADDHAPATSALDVVRLPGRDRILAELVTALDAARQGRGSVWLIEGEGGIGKTSVLNTLLDTAGQVDVLRATADPTGVLPLGPVLDAIDGHLAALPRDDRAAALGAEADLLSPLLLPGASSGSPAYRDLLAGYEPGTPAASAALHVAVLAVLSRLAAQRPLVLAIDDVHQADPSTISWLGLLAQRCTHLPILAVVARRPGDSSGIHGARRVNLEPLDRGAAALIVGADRVDELLARSGGNPLFLVELARSTDDKLPESIRHAVVGRLADTGEAAATLRCAAELGAQVDLDLLASVLGEPARSLLDHLEEGQRRDLLVDGPSGFVFRHDLLRDALAADTPSARRAWLHREAATVLADRPRSDPLRVAHHARLGGDLPLAARALRDAAEIAGARFDHDEALRLANESLVLEESEPARLVQARSLMFLRRYDEARVAAAQARTSRPSGDALLVEAAAAYYGRDLEAVRALADAAAATVGEPDALAYCQYLAAKVDHTIGNLAAVESRLTESISRSAAAGGTPFLRLWRGFARLQRGDLDGAEADLSDSDRARAAPIPYAPLYVAQFGAQLAGLQGRPLQTLALADELRTAVAAQHAVRFGGRAEVYRGWALSMLCAPDAADALEEAREVARTTDNKEPLGQGTLDLACLHLDNGRLEAAERLLAEADEVTASGWQVSNAWRIELRGRYLEGRLALAAGDPTEAMDIAEDVRARSIPEAVTRFIVLADLLSAEAAATAGAGVDEERLAALITDAERVARPEAWRTTGRLSRLLGGGAWRRRFEAQVDELVAHSGDHAERIRASAAALVD